MRVVRWARFALGCVTSSIQCTERLTIYAGVKREDCREIGHSTARRATTADKCSVYTRHHRPSLLSTIYSGKAAVVAALAAVFLARQSCVQSDAGRRPQAAAIAVQPACNANSETLTTQPIWLAAVSSSQSKQRGQQEATTKGQHCTDHMTTVHTIHLQCLILWCVHPTICSGQFLRLRQRDGLQVRRAERVGSATSALRRQRVQGQLLRTSRAIFFQDVHSSRVRRH